MMTSLMPVFARRRRRSEEGPGEALDEGSARHDEDAAEDQRQNDAAHQRELLIDARHPHAAQHDDEDEEVVDRQRVLSQVAGEELDGVVPTRLVGHRVGKQADADAEHDGQHDVDADPDRRLLHGGLVQEDKEAKIAVSTDKVTIQTKGVTCIGVPSDSERRIILEVLPLIVQIRCGLTEVKLQC